MPIKRALISVSDKMGLVAFAQQLARLGVEIYSSGGTARVLAEHEVPVEEISKYTEFPEILGGRVKTLHPRVAGGILARRNHPDDQKALAEHAILPFDLVVVNLYPFEQTVRHPEVTLEQAVEQIDIGGPTLVRAAAKNHEFVTVVTDPAQYATVIDQLQALGETTAQLRRELAAKAFRLTAHYDQAIAGYLAGKAADEGFPEWWHVELRLRKSLRYGENPHQPAAFYVEPGYRYASLGTAQTLHGKELSFNNLLDLDSALSLLREFADPAAVVIKHTNPCGAACASNLTQAFLRAYEGDTQSAFGSVIGFNRELDDQTSRAVCETAQFVEAILAPDFSAAALEMLTSRPTWKRNVRLLKIGPLEAAPREWDYRRVAGGLLVQQSDVEPTEAGEWKLVSKRAPTDAERTDLEFAWQVARHVKSNAIVLARGRQLVGVGAGQMSRVDSAQIAARKAGSRAEGAVLASDAFFPFRDGVDEAAEAGVTAIVQPGGSRRDPEVIRAADEHNLAMLFTGLRHFRH